jgi:hypothetical protein
MSNADLTAIIDADAKELIAALKDATDEIKKFEEGTGQSLKKLDDQFASTFGSIKDAHCHGENDARHGRAGSAFHLPEF